MKTDFFSKFKHFLENKNTGMIVGLKDGQMIVSISFQSTTDEDEGSSPIIIKGTPEEMDEGFIEAVGKSMEKIEKVIGLSVNTSALDKQSEEADKDDAKSKSKKSADKKKDEPKYKGKPLDAKAKSGIKKVEEYIKEGKFDNAEVHLKSQCDKFMNHPDVIGLLEEIKTKQVEAEETAEGNTEEATEVATEAKEGDLSTLNAGTVKGAAPKVETPAVEKAPEVKEEPKKEEPKPVTLGTAFAKTAEPAKEEKKEEVKEIPISSLGAKPAVITEGFDESKYIGLPNVDLMKLATDEKGKGNIRKAYDIILCLLKNAPTHPIANLRKAEYEKLLNL